MPVYCQNIESRFGNRNKIPRDKTIDIEKENRNVIQRPAIPANDDTKNGIDDDFLDFDDDDQDNGQAKAMPHAPHLVKQGDDTLDDRDDDTDDDDNLGQDMSDAHDDDTINDGDMLRYVIT